MYCSTFLYLLIPVTMWFKACMVLGWANKRVVGPGISVFIIKGHHPITLGRPHK